MLEAERDSLSNGHERYDFVIGIDLGSITSGASIAHKKRPFEIYTVNNWDGASDSTGETPKQLPTTIFYKKLKQNSSSSNGFCKEDYEIFCGLPPLHTIATMRKEADDIYIDYIKQLVLAMDSEFNHPKVSQYGLTVKDIFTDFIKGFHEKVIGALQTHLNFQQSLYFTKEFSINGNLDNVRYCIACPVTLQNDFIKQCFVDAGIIGGDQKEDRISFVTESEATAYSCLALNREETEVQMDNEYLVGDFGHNSFGLSLVTADSTESASKVELISENIEIGSKLFTTKLKDYMMEQKRMSESEADRILKPYVDKEEYFDFELDADEQRVVKGEKDMAEEHILYPFGDNVEISKTDLYTHIFLPVIQEVEATISAAYTARKIENVYISGKYACDTYFKNYLMENKVFGGAIGENAVLNKVEDSVSIGAVSSGLRKKKMQVPYLTHQKVDTETNQNQSEEGGNDDQSKSSASSEEHKKDIDKDNQKQQKKKDYKYVFGIDFGTTFSGCSYAKYEPELYAKCKNIEDYRELMKTKIDTVEKWDGDYKYSSGKTPTCIMYKDLNNIKNLAVDSWGRDAENTYYENRMRSDYKRKLLKDFKLFLEVKHSKENYAKNGKTEFNKKQQAASSYKEKIDVVNVIIADYLRLLNNEALRKASPDTKLTSRDVKYVFTVPAIWGRPARELIAAAAFKADIINEVNEDDFCVISEPEAAALFCETEFDDFLTKEDETFIVCDAGGGTIDLVAFKYKAKTGENEAEISQIGEPDGDMCGSTYLDLAFEEYVRGYYGKIGAKKDTVDIGPALKKFVEETKPEFKFCQSKCGDELSFDLVDKKGCKKNHECSNYRVKNNKLYMTHKQMKEKVFDGVFNKLIKLLDRKIAKHGIEKVDSILLVGGFGQNAYLQEILTEKYEKNVQKPQQIKVIFSNSDRGVKCVSSGAVSYGLLPRLITQAIVDRSFALEVLAPLQRNTDETKIINGYHTSQDQRYVKNCLEYFIEKNSPLMFENFSISKTIYIERDYSAIIAMYTCNLNPGEEAHQQDYKILDPLFHEKAVEMRIDPSELQHYNRSTPLIPIEVTLRIERSQYYVTVKCDSIVIQKHEGSNKDDRLINLIRKNPKIPLKNTPKAYWKQTSRTIQARLRKSWFSSR